VLQVRENLDAFFLACDGVSTCDGDCKAAFDTKYMGCARAYVPLIVERGFQNEGSSPFLRRPRFKYSRFCPHLGTTGLKRILDACVPNDRQKPIKFNFHVFPSDAFESGDPEPNDPMIIAAVDFAIDVVRQDPGLFKGYAPEITYTVFDGGSANAEGAAAASTSLHYATKRNETIHAGFGTHHESTITFIAETYAAWEVVSFAMMGGVAIGDPRNKVKYPWLVGSLVSGAKILGLFAPILKKWNFLRMFLMNMEGDVVSPVLGPTLQSGGIEVTRVTYSKFQSGLDQIPEKRQRIRQARSMFCAPRV
jgi:hypothetical protein